MSALDLVTDGARASEAPHSTAGGRAAPGAPGATIDAFERRAAEVDAGQTSVRDGLAELGRLGLPQADLLTAIELVATVAQSDLATAFSAWAHRMVIDYVSTSPPGSDARRHLPALATAETLGVTALAAGTAHVLAGVPLPVTFREEDDALVLQGRIPWASNLLPPFLVVTAAAAADDPSRTVVVALPHDLEGIVPAPFPSLLALGATGSTTVKLEGVRVARALVIAEDVHSFVRSILARFLLLQGAFCSGLAHRALEEATASLGPTGEAVRDSLEGAWAETREAVARTAGHATAVGAGAAVPVAELLALRLRWSEIARAAVHLELAVAGGRGYLQGSPTARRVREVAFLPIQAPTEVMLRWLLSRSG